MLIENLANNFFVALVTKDENSKFVDEKNVFGAECISSLHFIPLPLLHLCLLQA